MLTQLWNTLSGLSNSDPFLRETPLESSDILKGFPSALLLTIMNTLINLKPSASSSIKWTIMPNFEF